MGPKTRLGGIQAGLHRLRYQLLIDGVVKNDPNAAAAKQIKIATAKPIALRDVIIHPCHEVPRRL